MSTIVEVKRLLGNALREASQIVTVSMSSYNHLKQMVLDVEDAQAKLEPLQLEVAALVASRDYMEKEMLFYQRMYREKSQEILELRRREQ